MKEFLGFPWEFYVFGMIPAWIVILSMFFS